MIDNSNRAAKLEAGTYILQNEISQLRQALHSEIRQITRQEGFASSLRRLRVARNWTLSTKTFNFSFGKVIVRKNKSMAYSTAQQGRLQANRSRIDATFIPSPLFWRTRISLLAECAAHLNSFAIPTFSLQFLDIIQDGHPLILASTRGDLSALQCALASQEVSLLCSTMAGWTPLHYAAAYGQTAACKFLIANGASLHATGVRGISPLHLAAHFGHVEVFKILVEAGIDPDESHEHGLNSVFEILSIGAGRASMDLTEFLQWLLRGQEHFFLDVQARDNSQRSILYHLANPPDRTYSPSHTLTTEQASAIGLVLDEGASGDEIDFHEISLLHESCQDNRMDLVKLLLSGSCNVNGVDGRGYTALHYAVESGNLELVSLLIKRGADVNVGAYEGFFKGYFWSERPTPLYLAAMIDQIDMVQLLMEQGAGRHDENVTDAFHVALRVNSIDIARYFIEHAKDQLDLRHAISTVEHWPDLIEELYRAGAPLDHIDENGWTPLLTAARNGWTDVVRILVELGADLNLTGNDLTDNASTPLRFAVEGGYADVASVLLAAGARIEPPNEHIPTLRQLAISRGYNEIADLIASNISGEPSTGQDPVGGNEAEQGCDVERDITTSCVKGDLAVVEKLLEKGCSLKTAKTSLWSPLSLAISWKRWEVVRRLIQAGAELNFCGNTADGLLDMPFMDAVCNDNAAMIEFMIAHGADVHIRTEDGATPLLQCLDRFWSRGIGSESTCDSNGMIVRALLKAGACANVIDDYGRTALGKAAAVGNLEAVIALVEAGANLDKLSSQNSFVPIRGSTELKFRTPIAWAALEGHESVVRFLFDSGAEWRCLRKEPAVWYTHRLLMESCFPNTQDNASKATTTVSILKSTTCEANSKFTIVVLQRDDRA